MTNCVDAHLGQIVCDKDGVMEWCIVPLEKPLSRFEECWPLPMESLLELPLKPQHSNPNPNPLVNQLWSVDFLTPPTILIIPRRPPASLNLLCHSKTDARFMQDGWYKSSQKHSIRFCRIFSKFKTEFHGISFF